ncbi:DUF3574 domain-containing protein [Phenylobacterium immobile]|uniref:DUF3574 domain-containing protein n=1 Tax=Phenylobacterium immobile TaxID=21 RepID=UPI000B0C8097|nr:DUF3574 domain-containing protein [Phenylobacterium immobile]
MSQTKAGWMLAGVVALLGLAGCAHAPAPQAAALTCSVGQERLRTAQLFFGRSIGGKPDVTDAQFRDFMDNELTPRFPDGLTVLDGGGQWRGEESRLIREAAKVVMIVLRDRPDAERRIDAARAAYKQRFAQESVLVVTQPACVSF